MVQEKEKLQDANVELQEEVSMLETKLESMNKSLRMLNNGSNVLDEILKVGKEGRSMKGIGFDYKSTNQEGQNTRRDFVASESQTEFKKQIEYQVAHKKPQHQVQHMHTHKSEVLKMSLGGVTIVVGMDILDPSVSNCMFILKYKINHRS